MASGDHERALACFEAAVAAQPDLAIAHLGRAVCHFTLGQEQAGMRALDDALAVGDDDGNAFLIVARTCASTGRGTLAMDLLSVALAVFPTLTTRVASDVGFQCLRDHPRFLQLVGEL